MSSRLEIELTSTRPDGSWTWRKAGAKLPKGEIDGAKLPAGSQVGDVLRVEADLLLDGVEILTVLPPKDRKGPRHETIQVVGSGRRGDEALVTTQLAPKGRGRDRDRPGRRRDGERGDRDRGPRRDGDRRDRRPGSDEGDRRRRPPRDEAPRRAPAPRLRAGRTHRNAVLADLPAEHRPIAEQVLRGGIPAVRQAVAEQNARNRDEGLAEITGDELVTLAERMLPKLKTAEWRDRADAALAALDEVDLRDLRSVVVAADGAARDDESRSLAQQLRDGLARRVDAEHAQWLDDLRGALRDGRIVRALRLSSRPPKAGAPLPGEVAAQLVADAVAALSAEATADRWTTVLDALSFSPVRAQVTPASLPTTVTDELTAAIAKAGDRLPHIAALFGIEVTVTRSARRGKGRARPGAPGATTTAAAPSPRPDVVSGGPHAATTAEEAPVEAPVTEAPVTEAPVVEAPVEEAPVVEAPVEEAPVVQAPVAEAPVVQAPVEEAPVVEAPVEEALVEEATALPDEAAGSDQAEQGE